MTIRGGGRPRQAPQAHSLDPEPASWAPSRGGGRRPQGYLPPHRAGGRHTLRFLVFILVLAGVVLFAMATVLRPVAISAAVSWTDSNPGALKMPFVADLVREDLGSSLAQPAGQNADPTQFAVNDGDTPSTLAPRLKAAGLIANERAFVFEATLANLGEQLKTGNYLIAGNLTPKQVVAALSPQNRITVTTLDVTFREGLRLEQIVAKLQTIQSGVDPKAFYDLVEHPPASLVADYPFLKGRTWPSLEGFLYPATFTLRTDPKDPTTAEDLVRMMLDAFKQNAGDLTKVPKSRGLTFPQVLVLASLVEREAKLDSERALIAGVYQNRLDPKLFPNGHLGSDPSIFYVYDSLQLSKLPFEQWDTWSFWGSLPKGTTLPAQLPDDLASYNTYTRKGLPIGPICSPARASIEAALAPDTKDHYLYFIAKNDGSNTTAFAKTYAEHQQNVAKYKQP